MASYEDAFEDNKEESSFHGYTARVVNLRKLMNEALESLESSFEAAKRTMDQLEAQIREVRLKLESTTRGRRINSDTIDFDDEGKLEQLKKEVRTLKYKVPYDLIYPPVDSQFIVSGDPNVVWHPRNVGVHSNNPSTRDKTYELTRTSSTENMDLKLAYCNPNFCFLRHPDAPLTDDPSSDELEDSLNSLTDSSMRILRCFCVFPEEVIVKRSILFNCWLTHSYDDDYESESSSEWEKEFNDAMNNLVAKGFLLPIYKKSTSSVSSYWMEQRAHLRLRSIYRRVPISIHLSPTPRKEREILYINNPIYNKDIKYMKAILFGKWHKSLPLSQHIEVADPDSFYKGMDNLTEVKYISLRGISMIPELPQFVTNLKKLQILDCKSCYNLEVIPDNINKLSRTLTHLDMSDCYLLDHMPTTLSDLIHLEVLKGFHVGVPDERKSCTLRSLTTLSKLRKLHIYTSEKGFPNTDQLRDLLKFRSLRNLGISWRGWQTHDEKSTTFATTLQRVLTHKDSIGRGRGDQQQFSFDLEKLDLQCVPDTVTRVLLNPVTFKGLKKLYIMGGNIFDLGQKLGEPKEDSTPVIGKENQWTVEILRLKYLRELKMDKSEVDNLFPELLSLEKVDCPNLTSINCDDNGIWLKSRHPPPTMSL